MRLPSPLVALLAASGFGLAHAQYLINELSFGHSGRIETPTAGTIPYFSISGTPNTPHLYSNKLVLTPPSPGNARAALWATTPLQHRAWIADIDFRATGPERAGGHLNIWLVRDGQSTVDTSSIYSVGRFDGLALVVNAQGGSGGMVRGFLNDGTTDYAARRTVDDLAFGHCLYSYRNLGRPSQIKLRQNAQGFTVDVDGRLCFETDKFTIPPGYRFGITAATPDIPDSFEVFKMVVMSENAQPDMDDATGSVKMNGNAQASQQQQQQQQQRQVSDGRMGDEMPDADAELFTTSKAQFTDLHNRLQAMSRQITHTFQSMNKLGPAAEARHAETSKMIHDLTDEVRRLAGIEAELGSRVSNMENEVRALKREIHSRVTQSEHALRGYFTDQHATLSEVVMDSAQGKHLRVILVVVGSQLFLVGSYVWYKRRKNTMPKKFL